MGIDFDHVLTGVGMRPRHVGQQHLVNDLSRIGGHDVTVVQPTRLDPVRARPMGPEQARGNGQGLGPAEAHDADSPLAYRGGDGDDGVIEGVHVYLRQRWRGRVRMTCLPGGVRDRQSASDAG